MPTGGIVGQCSLPAGHFGHGPRPKLFPLAEHAFRNLLLRNQEPLELGVAPLPATSGLLFTLAGAFLPLRRNPPSLSGSVSSKGPRVFSVRLGLVRFRLRRFFCGTGEKKVNFLEAPLPVSSDEASKSSRLKALRWRNNQTRPVLEKRSSITVVLTASREIGRNISFRCAFFGIYGFILLPLVVLVVSNRNLCAQVFFFLFFSSPNPRKNSHWRMVDEV